MYNRARVIDNPERVRYYQRPPTLSFASLTWTRRSRVNDTRIASLLQHKSILSLEAIFYPLTITTELY